MSHTPTRQSVPAPATTATTTATTATTTSSSTPAANAQSSTRDPSRLTKLAETKAAVASPKLTTTAASVNDNDGVELGSISNDAGVKDEGEDAEAGRREEEEGKEQNRRKGGETGTTRSGSGEERGRSDGGGGAGGGNNKKAGEAQAPVPLAEDIMQLARMGEVGMVKNLFETGKFDARHKDEEGITPLHWAAINNQYALCDYLISAGADVNAKGGQSMATPTMWAAQRCHYYVVDLFLRNGADPTIPDFQGYNILHLATFEGNPYLLLLALHQQIPVDSSDPSGHTPLMWAAYRGYPTLVDIFLRWGADVHIVDDAGLTALHWALVRGSLPCIHKLLEYGADRFAKTHEGKTPATMAMEMNTSGTWQKALANSGFTGQGEVMPMPMRLPGWIRNTKIMARIFFMLPSVDLLVAIFALVKLPLYLAVPIIIFTAAMVRRLTIGLAEGAGSPEFKSIQRTPFLLGLFSTSLFLVGVRSITTVIPNTYHVFPLTTFLYVLIFCLASYFFVLATIEDPGFVPKLSSRKEQWDAIVSLLDEWAFDEEHFCIHCLNQKPERSKHCFLCKRCVFRHDHHCPWIYNCVGLSNLRHFVLYLVFLEIGILMFVDLVALHISILPISPSSDTCILISTEICDVITRDPTTMVLTVWVALQLVWITMLCSVQFLQISRNQTTYESMRRRRHLHASGASPSASQSAAAAAAAGFGFNAGVRGSGSGGHIPAELASVSSRQTAHTMESHNNANSPQYYHHQRRGCFAQFKTMLGIDAFVATATDELAAAEQGQGRGQRQRSSRMQPPPSSSSRLAPPPSPSRFPYSKGWARNCEEFWCDGHDDTNVNVNGNGSAMPPLSAYFRMARPPPPSSAATARRSYNHGADAARYV